MATLHQLHAALVAQLAASRDALAALEGALAEDPRDGLGDGPTADALRACALVASGLRSARLEDGERKLAAAMARVTP